jgi:hypothetical protein
MPKLEPHVCPECRISPATYYGRLARRGTKEVCPNHTSTEEDEDGNKVQQVELVYLVPLND